MKVDTSYISKKYETQLLQGIPARDLVMGVWKEVPVVEEEDKTKADTEEGGEGETEYVYKVVPNGKTLKLPAHESLKIIRYISIQYFRQKRMVKKSKSVISCTIASQPEPIVIRTNTITNCDKSHKSSRQLA